MDEEEMYEQGDDAMDKIMDNTTSPSDMTVTEALAFWQGARHRADTFCKALEEDLQRGRG